ncbi:uncharacterized protein UV8b_03705 [Ustilaginoidea virens]|uniref:U3 snoRNA associated n=1 Tax=Ustilaginoidea virens TaxID=1159556 RepID=A0A063BZC1_USTVR|nr:uncharacterized protein UV8b_03705 [Ustilaginoidea virens]QUC19464.1 hypothetical protein UV8b_03705 [Ustilaginoidea virens]GAO13286.1 hypothetical protein UVI_02026310 [Ustilaginoidea virens]
MPVETRKRKAAMAKEAQAAKSAPPSSSTPAIKRQRSLPVRAKEGDDGIPSKDDVGSKPPQNNVITFDDCGNPDRELAISAVEATDVSEALEQEASDSDEAPEAVSTSKVAKKMIESAQAFQKAAREQAAAEKEKRRQRDALFKQQASVRKEAEAGENTGLVVPGPIVAPAGKKWMEQKPVPDMLPLDYLTDSSSEDGDEDRVDSAASRQRKRKRNVASVEKRLSRESRGPRDQVVGSTIYRVSKPLDKRLAPKANKHSKSTKQLLLKRGREPVKSRSLGFAKR